MPLSRISEGDTPLAAFTFRELAQQRRLAVRAVRRGRNPQEARRLIARIEAELEARRARLFDRRGRDAPGLPGPPFPRDEAT